MEEQTTVQTQVDPAQVETQPEIVGGEEKLVKKLDSSDSKKGLAGVLLPVLVILAIILVGVGTGYFLANRGVGSLPGSEMIGEGGGGLGGGKEAGLKDEESFPDKAEGKIEANEDEEMPEGSHKLLRVGGESQTAYLTSSVVNLNDFNGQCVEIWGETFSAQKAGWFMDVGYVKKIDKCPEGL